MKKLLVILAILTSVVAVFESCRKGPNDPFFSIRSRKSRLVGIWKFNTITIDSTSIKDNGINSTNSTVSIYTSFSDSTKKTEWTVSGNKTEEIDSVYSETLVINEDGTYSDTIRSRKLNKENTPVTKFTKRVVANKWFWLNSTKNKEGIELVGYGIFTIDRLAWKELVLTSSKKNIRITSSTTNTISVTKQIKFKRS